MYRQRPLISVGPITTKKAYDYIVLGAGSGGCAAAGSLAQYDKKASVALIEAGPPDSSVLVDSPLLAALVVPGLVPFEWAKKFLWKLESASGSPSIANRRSYHPRGCGLGGCSSVNAALYIRGHPLDYRDWGQRFKGWSYEDVLPAFKRMENNSRGPSEVHGGSGGLYVEDPSSALHNNAINAAFKEACFAAGLRLNTDFNGKDGTEGYGVFQANTHNGRRVNSYDAHIQPIIAERENFNVMTNTAALELNFEGKRCVGVTVAPRSDGGVIDYSKAVQYTAKEVIVSLGSFHTPPLLERSGIGAKDLLLSKGVQNVVCDNAEVGQNLIEHMDLIVTYKAPQLFRSRSGSLANLGYLYQQWKEWKAEGTGQFSGVVEMGGFVKSHEKLDRPDIQLHFVTAPLVDHARKICPFDGFSLHACNLYPRSRGTVHMASTKAEADPLIDMNYLDHADDIRTMEQCLLWAQLLTDPAHGLCGGYTYDRQGPMHPLAVFDPQPYTPKPHETSSREKKIDWIRRNADNVYHPVGSCGMGTVVDEKLRVKGVDGLRIADCSVIPSPLGGNTNAPAQMIGARCADFVLEDA